MTRCASGPGWPSPAICWLAWVPVAWALLAPAVAWSQDNPGDSLSSGPGRLTVELRAEHGERVTSATVRLLGPRDAAGRALVLQPDGAGRYRADRLAAAHYRLEVTALGYGSETMDVDLTGGDTAFRRVVLEAAPLELPRLLARGSPDSDATVAGHAVSRIDFTEQAVAYRSIAEWLATQPGVATRQLGPGGRQVVGVRGSRPEAVLVLLDGVPINDPLTGAADLSSIPVASLQSASLVRGTSSARYGPGATSGVLLLRSRAPSGPEWNAALEAGSLGYRAADLFLATGGTAGQAGLFIRRESAENAFWFANRTLPGGPEEQRRNTDVSGWHATLSLQSAAAPLSAHLRFDDRERGVPGRMGTGFFDGARWSDRSVQASAQLGHQRRGTLTGGLRLQRLGYESADGRPPSSSHLSTIDLAGALPPLEPIGVELLGRMEREAVTGTEITGSPDRWTAGVAATRPFGWANVAVQPSLAFDVAPGQTAWSPELAVTVRPDPRLETWARLGRGFRLPTFADLYFASAYRIEPNPDLTAETVAFDGELGARWGGRPGEPLEVQLVAFRRLTQDPIVWLASAAAVWSPQNLDRLEAHGMELGAWVRSRDGTWRLGGQATYTNSRLGFGDNRNPLPYEPTWAGSALLERAAPRWAARVEVVYTGARSTSIAATRQLPAYVRLDLGGRTLVGLGAVTLSLQARVINLLNRRYEYVELFPEPGRRVEIRVEGF